jgi:endoglucanase
MPPMRNIDVHRALSLLVALATLSGAKALGASTDNDLVPSQTRPIAAERVPMRLHVQGTRLLNARGESVLLRGVNIASLEWTTQGEHMEEAFDHAIHQWKANIIRMPLAQDRWFGKTAGQKDGGASYRALVDKLVDASAAAGAYIDLDLHWSDCGTWANEGSKLAQHPMPDAHSVLFWTDIATRYKNQPNVLFGLYNEPHDIAWAVWRDGGTVTEKPSKKETNQPPVVYEAVGLQELYDTVRAVGAENVVTISGNEWGYDLRGVLQGHAITGSNLVYETHPYSFKKDWDKSFGEVSKQYPVFMGEWGGNAKNLEYGQRLMDYAQERGLHWTAWCFHPSCGPPLLKNWTFEPNDFGLFVKTKLSGAGSPGS